MIALLALARRRRNSSTALLFALGCLAGGDHGVSGACRLSGRPSQSAGFVGYSLLARRRMAKSIFAVIAVVIVALPVGQIFVESVGSSVFSRYTSISPEKVTSTASELNQTS